jgi:hypothetical protein
MRFPFRLCKTPARWGQQFRAYPGRRSNAGAIGRLIIALAISDPALLAGNAGSCHPSGHANGAGAVATWLPGAALVDSSPIEKPLTL